jgi:hypothetical protein
MKLKGVTSFRNGDDLLEIFQKIKLHLIMTTFFVGIFFGLFFKALAIALTFFFIAIAEFFIRIRITVDKKQDVLLKELLIFGVKFYQLYSITGLSRFTLIALQSGRGDGATAVSYDLVLRSPDNKDKELLTFESEEERAKVVLILKFYFPFEHIPSRRLL